MAYYPSLAPEERRRRRCFHRVVSGLEKGGELRLLTLTESPSAVNPIQRDLRRLVMRLRRRGLLSDYIRVIELTREGREHVHMCFRGKFIDQRLVSYLWEQIHQSPVVDIRRVKPGRRNKRGVASYLAKYMSKEGHRRYSWSWGWVYRGFVTFWRDLIRRYRAASASAPTPIPFFWFLSEWQKHLRSRSPPGTYLPIFCMRLYDMANPIPPGHNGHGRAHLPPPFGGLGT